MLRKSLDDLKFIIKDCDIKVISDKFLGTDCCNVYTFECLVCDNRFDRTYPNILINKKCPNCNKKKFVQYNKLKQQDVVDALKAKGISAVGIYKNARSPIDLKCDKCDCLFSNAFCNVKAGSGCPNCANGSSIVEEEVRSIFETIFNKSFPTVRPNFLKNPETKINLELDGYCEELKLAFEYDGEFHYKENPWRSEALFEQKKRDELKDFLCKNAGVRLIRIPYWEKHNLEKIIKDNISKSNKEGF